MQLSDFEAKLVQESFRRVAAEGSRAAEVVYRHLFQIAPQTRELFITGPERQHVKFFSSLSVIIMQIHDPDLIQPMLQDMAMRHLAYGVKPEHYQYLGVALQAALTELLGGSFTPETQRAWGRAWGLIAGIMTDTAYPKVTPGFDLNS